MLEDVDRPQFGTVWWRGLNQARSLSVHASAATPQKGKCSFFAPDFTLANSDPWFHGEPLMLDFTPQPLPTLVHRAEPSSAEFAQVFEDIQRHLQAGHFEKVVPIVCEHLEFAEPLCAQMFSRAILQDHPLQINYGFEFNGEGMVGVTPELLFQVKDGRLSTMALAGTGVQDGPSLLDDAKERFEHQLVIDHIYHELKRWGVPEVGRTEERGFGALKHLYTSLSVQLQETPDFMQILVRLHPTAALGGWPRQPAVEWLEQQKFHVARRRFGAPFGFVEGDEMMCAVAIRCLQWSGPCALLSAGCGVVKESEVLREWCELQLKRQAICKLLGLNL